MADLGGGPDRPLFQSVGRHRRTRRSAVPVVLGVVVALLAVGAGWYWYSSRGEPEEPPQPRVAAAEDSLSTEPPDPPLELPELDTSDALVREVVSRLSEHPRLAAWLAPDELVRRFVTSVVNVAGGESPAAQLPPLQVEEPFPVIESGERLLADPVGYRRYDALTETLVSIDTRDAARLYRQLHPLFEEAHRELGLVDRSFDESMALALGNLLSVEVPEGDLEVVPNEALYDLRDARLQALTPAEKHVVRLGPRNARRVQDKLRSLALAIGITPANH